jgi:hypothetical protein
MKTAFFIASLCCAFFLVGCADTSLQTDEDYRASHGPAPFSPDYSSRSSGYGY